MVGLVALVASLAGCSEGAKAPDAGDLASPSTVLVTGVVVDDAIRPLADARIELDGSANTTTDANGAFTLEAAPGAHVVRATKSGYADAVTQLTLSASEEPPVLKLVLLVDTSLSAYAELFAIDGFVECSMHTRTHSFAACGTGNVASFIACAQVNVCMGNVTQDRYITIIGFTKQPDFLTCEVSWTSTQALGTNLRIMMGSANAEELRFYPNTPKVHNDTTGPSPVYVTMDKGMLVESGIGIDSWFLAQTFAAPTDPAPLPGMVLQQRFTMYLTSFYGYEPPLDWRFTATGETPPPPSA